MIEKNKSVVWLIITVVWMAVIFCFSAQPANVSTDTSLHVGMAIGKMSVPDFSKLPKEKQMDYAEKNRVSRAKNGTCDRVCDFGLFTDKSMSDVSYEKSLHVELAYGKCICSNR